MVFSSITFLFLFLPLFLVGYHFLWSAFDLVAPGMSRRAANLFLLFASGLFYFWGEQFLIWLVVASTAIDYVCGLFIARGFRAEDPQSGLPHSRRTWMQSLALGVSVCSNLAFLAYFKYVNFGISAYNEVAADTVNGLAGSLLLPYLWPIAGVTLPLGISFYTFQSMSYTIDVYRGRVPATRNAIDFACFVTMFPQLVAGPILRYRDVAGQLTSRERDSVQFASGVARFVTGLAKKVLIANTLAVTADRAFALESHELTTGIAWLGILAYTFQIYFDFSGYSDMAIGLGRMCGFEFIENFNYPYAACSMRDFWQRWHISLSNWFRDYVYIPLGGNRRSATRTYFNLVVVFLLCGLWHGASWNFILWGALHGAFLAIERRDDAQTVLRKYAFIGRGYVWAVVIAGWVMFRSDDMGQAMSFYRAMAGFAQASVAPLGLSPWLRSDILIAFACGAVFAIPTSQWLWRRLLGHTHPLSTGDVVSPSPALQIAHAVLLACLFVLSTMQLAGGTHNPFIYFRF